MFAAQFGSAAFLIVVAYTKSKVVAVTGITLSAGVMGLQIVGASANHLDLAPRYAGVLMGFTNFASSMSGIVGPFIADALTVSKKSTTAVQLIVSFCPV